VIWTYYLYYIIPPGIIMSKIYMILMMALKNYKRN